MADEKDDEILLTVKIDEGASEKKLADLTQQKIQLKAARDALNKSFKDAKITEAEYAKGLSELTLKERAVGREIAAEQKTLENVAKARNAASGSIDQMKANLSLLTESFDALSDAEKKNEEVGGVLEKRIKSLSDELKGQEEATGRTYRSVGDYMKLVRVGGQSVGDLQEAFKEGTQGVQVFAKGILTGKGALTALTAVPILALLLGLYTLLTKSQAGMDKFAQYTKAAELALSALTDGFIKNTKIILEAFTSWDKFKNLFTDLRRNADATTDAMAKAARAGMEIAKANQQIEAAEIKLGVQRAKNIADIEQYKKISEDVTKSNATRTAAAKKAYALENATIKESLNLQQQRIDNLRREINLNDTSRSNRENQKKLAEEETKYYEMKAESLGKQNELQNSLNGIVQEGIDKAKEAAALAAQESIAQAERALVMAKRKGQETLSIEEEIIRRRATAEKLALTQSNTNTKKTAQQRLLVEAKANADIIQLRIDHAIQVAEKEAETSQNRINAQLALTRKGTQAEYDLQKKLLESTLTLEKARAVDTIKDKKQLTARLRLLDAQYNAGVEAIDDAAGTAQIERDGDLANKRLQTKINLGKQTLEEQFANQRAQIAQEEKFALELLDLEERTAKERGQLDDKLREELLVRRNEIQSRALAQKKEIDQQELEQTRKNAIARAEADLAGLVEGSYKYLQKQKEILKKRHDLEIANSKLTKEEKEKIDAEYVKNRKDLDGEYAKELAEQIIQTASLATDGLSVALDAQAKAAENALNKQQEAAVRSAGANAELRGRIEESFQKKRDALEKEAARKRQKIASVENKIQALQAGTAALELFAKNPVLGAITELLILTKAAANQKLIDQQAFADGGVYVSDGKGAYVTGPGTGTSDSINARISNGESILTAKATQMFYPELSAMNVAGGGRAFPNADDVEMPQMNFAFGGVPKPNDGGLMDMVKAIKDLNIFVSVTDIDNVKTDMTKAKAQGDY